MIHPSTALVPVSSVVGVGIVATQRIPRGTITWVLDDLDRVFTEAEVQRFDPCYEELLDHWTFNDGRGHRVLCWDTGRYVNHSCDANCAGSELGFEVALRDIAIGEQLTNDYGTMFMRPTEWFPCCCGTTACRGIVSAKETAIAVATMRRKVFGILPFLEGVEQPLRSLLPPERLTAARNELSLEFT